MTPHPLVEAASRWTTNEDTLTRAREIGDQVDALVTAALASTDPAVIANAVCQLDILPGWFATNMPGPSWSAYYARARQALTARAVLLFGRAEGARIAKPLEHAPLTVLPGWPGQIFPR